MNLDFSEFDWRKDLPAQRRLFSESFPENSGQPIESSAYYHRKFQAFPAEPPSREFIASDDSGFVGYYAAIPFSYRFEGQAFRGGMVCDVMTSPRMQGKGVFTKLGAYSLDQLTRGGFDFVTGYPRRPAVIPGHLKVGWQILFRLPMFLMPLKAGSLLRSRRAGWLAPLVDPFLWALRCGLDFVGTGEYAFEIWDWKEFLERHDYSAFVTAWAATRQITLDKTPEFLRWRLSIQEVDYRVVAVKKAGALVGLSVVRACDPEGVPALGVLDLMTLDEDPRILRALRIGWIQLCNQWNREVILMMVSEYHAKRMRLYRLGFLRTPTIFSFIVKRLSARAQAELPLAPEAWHLMWIDSDDL